MPITVSCPACSSRFSLSDDLYRRRVAGSLVRVKCRNCHAEIAVDATEALAASNEAPRKQAIPPRRKSVTKAGLGVPPAPAALATSSPLPFDAEATPLPLSSEVTPLPISATITPLPLSSEITPRAVHAAPAPPVSSEDETWSEEPTIAINLANVKPPPRPPVVRRPRPLAEEEPPELVEAEEVPVSSSGVPTLDALTEEAGGSHVPHGKPAPDEFLVRLSASHDGMLVTDTAAAVGAPTIDVTSFASEIDPPSVDVTLDEAEPELEYRRRRVGTVPLYGLDGVLPGGNRDAGRDRASGAAPEPSNATDTRFSEGRPRERKYVIPPQVDDDDAPKSRRSNAALWLGAFAAAAAVAALVGARGLPWKQRVAADTPRALPEQPVVHNQAALPAEAVAAAPTETAVAVEAPSAAPAPAAPSAPTTQNIAAVGPAKPTPAAVKSTVNAPSRETVKPSASEPAVEKAEEADKPVEAHNAPPAAAPDTVFDRDAARNALASAASQASSCRKEGDPSGTAILTITFAPSGRVTSAQVQGPPFSGTATGGCIASTMRRASVPAFSGDYVTVSKTIVVQ